MAADQTEGRAAARLWGLAQHQAEVAELEAAMRAAAVADLWGFVVELDRGAGTPRPHQAVAVALAVHELARRKGLSVGSVLGQIDRSRERELLWPGAAGPESRGAASGVPVRASAGDTAHRRDGAQAGAQARAEVRAGPLLDRDKDGRGKLRRRSEARSAALRGRLRTGGAGGGGGGARGSGA